jgi:hypothetical protein
LGLKVSDKVAKHLNKDDEGLYILSGKQGGTNISFKIVDFKQNITTPKTPKTPIFQARGSARENVI